MSLLLDTSVCIELIRGRAPAIVARLRRRKIGTVGISAITFAELQFGVARSRDPARNTVALALFCAPLEICPFDHAAATEYGKIRTALANTGTPIGPLDTLVAAHALAMKAALLTNNQREFNRVPGLHVEVWKQD